MRPAAGPVLRRPVGTGPAALVLIVCAWLLAACSGTTLPFSKARDAPSVRTPPPIVVSAIAGLPAGQASAMFDALVSAAAQRDIAIARGEVANAHALAGEFMAVPTDTGPAVQYRWTLTDGTGRVLHLIEESEAGPATLIESWEGLDRDVVRRIAAYTAESLSSRMAQLGYATRAAGLPPPLDHLVEAGPDAEREIDYETLHGPYQVASGPGDGSQPPIPHDAARDSAEFRPPSQTQPEAQGASADPAIRGVAVTGVNGAGSAGNRELASALRQVLSDAGWPVKERLGDDVLAIEGDVSVGRSDGKAQKVALRWTVKAPGGSVLGTVQQANNVPAGSLDSGWGDAARYAAQAAAEGIFDLVDKLR